jgi:hypothetical protein
MMREGSSEHGSEKVLWWVRWVRLSMLLVVMIDGWGQERGGSGVRLIVRYCWTYAPYNLEPNKDMRSFMIS